MVLVGRNGQLLIYSMNLMDTIKQLLHQDADFQKKDQKQLIISFTIIFLALLCSIGVYFWSVRNFSKNYHPLLTEEKEFYFAISPQSSVLSQSDTIFVILSELTGEKVESMRPLFSQLTELGGDQVGFFKDHGSTFWFTRNPERNSSEQDFMIGDDANAPSFVSSEIQIDAMSYIIIGAKEFIPAIVSEQPSKLLLNAKKALNKEEKLSGNIIYTSFIRDEQLVSVLGTVRLINDIVQLSFMSEPKQGIPILESRMMEDSIFSLHVNSHGEGNPSPLLPSFQKQTESVVEVTQLLRQGQFDLYEGQIENFFENPYQEDLIWRWRGSVKNRDNIKEAILTDLSRFFPQSVEKELPDGSTILELQQLREVFEPVQTEEAMASVFTYPLGQLVLANEGDDITLSKGDIPKTIESVENSCVLPDFFSFGHVKTEALPLDLWKSAFFSYNQHNLVICIKP